MRRLFNLHWLVLLIFFSLESLGQHDPKLIKVRAEAWVAYSEAGDGYLFKLLSAAYEPLGYKVEFKFCPWKRCMQDVLEGKGDILLTLYGDEPYVGEYLQINKHPVYIERIGVAYKASRWPTWQGEEMLKGQRVGFIRGYELDQEIQVPVQVMEATNGKQLWRLLMAERIDFVMDGMIPLAKDRDLYADNDEAFIIKPMFTRPSYFGFLSSQRGSELAAVFNKRHIELYQAGAIKELLEVHGFKWDEILKPESLKP